VGIYYDDSGKVPLLECVRRAEIRLAEKPAARSYLPSTVCRPMTAR